MKKKILGVTLVFALILLVTGCGNTSEKSMTCTRTMNQNNMKTSLNYKVSYKGDTVTQVKSVETVETESSSILDSYKKQIEQIYSPYKGIEYYTYKVEVKDNKLTSTVDINYEKIDTKKLIEIDSANGSLIKDGKIKLSDMKSAYEQLGASCK